MIESIKANIEYNGMEHLRALDDFAPDGLAKEIVAYLAWNELLDDWQNEGCLLKAENKLRERLLTPQIDGCKGETFNDVLFVPQYSNIEHRGDIDTTCNMGKFCLALPLVTANMKDITGPKMAAKMATIGGLGILHRFGSIETSINNVFETKNILEQNGFYNDLPDWTTKEFAFGVSVGVRSIELERFHALYEYGARLFAIDVAHGHHRLVKQMIESMRKEAGNDICIIAGNVATVEGASDLKKWGADIIKVGIGPGSRCVTRRNIGVGIPQLKAIRNIQLSRPDIITISDGGIKHYGDIPKALKYSNAVMVGSLVAGTSETPGNVYHSEEGDYYKVYGGSASGERKAENGGNNSFVEGVVKTVKFKGKVKYILRQSEQSIQTAMSYAGCDNLQDFKRIAILEDIGSGAKQESRI